MPATSSDPKKPIAQTNGLPCFLVGAMLLMALAKLSIQLWGANKGFDVWDEGLYIMMLNFFEQYPTEPHNYYSYVITALLPLKEYGLLTLRYLAIGIETLGTLWFAFCIHRFVSYRAPASMPFAVGNFPLMLFVFATAAFLSVYPRAFSYNDFSYITTLAVSGSLMYFFKQTSPLSKVGKLSGLILVAVIGALLGAQLVVKFSTCILLALWSSAFIIVFANQPRKYIITLLATMFSGSIGFLFLLFGSFEGFGIWLQHLNNGIALLRQLAYEPYYILIKGYLYVDIVLNGVYFLAPLAASFAAQYILKSYTNLSTPNQKLLAYFVGIIIWLICCLTIHFGFLGEFHYRFIAVHIFTLLYWGIPVAMHLMKQRNWHWLLLLGMVAALPIMALLGSSNTATQTLTRYLASWFALIVWLLGFHFRGHLRALVAMLTFIMIFCGINYIVVQIYNPYGLNAPLTEQNTTVSGLHYLDGIVFDEPSATFFTELKKAVDYSGYEKGGPILALGDLCGTVTAMGGYIPETFWFFSDENAISPQHSRNYSCLHLNNLRLAEHPALPLIFINSGIHNQVIDCLIDSEIPFPESYRKQTTLYNPYAQESLSIWTPYNWKPIIH